MVDLRALHQPGTPRPIGRSDEPDGRCRKGVRAVMLPIKLSSRRLGMRVLLIDDHALFREGVALLLRPLVEPLEIWEAGSCEEAFTQIERRGLPELVLLDCNLTPEEIRRQHPTLADYLRQGEKKGIHRRYLPSHRPLWYRQEQRPPAVDLH